jgi:hypothetical protein
MKQHSTSSLRFTALARYKSGGTDGVEEEDED